MGADSVASVDAALAADLRRLGRLPAILPGALAVPLSVIPLSALLAGEPSSAVVVMALPSILLWLVFLLALRIRARVTPRGLVLRSYLRTYDIEFDDVLAFGVVGYAGFWNRFVAAEGFWNFGLHMLCVDAVEGRQDMDLRATMCSRALATRIAVALNRRVPDDMPSRSSE